MNKKKIIIIVTGVVLLFLVISGIVASGVLNPYERQIKLAYKLLSDGKYEEAILNFDKAIEIDAKRPKAYIGKADVYVARCDENAFEDIKGVIETGYAYHYDDETFVDALIRISGELYNKDKQKWSVDILKFGYDLIKDERLNEEKNLIINKFSDKFLSGLYTMFKNGETEAVKKEIQSEKYLEFMSWVDNEEFKYIYFPEKNKEQTGKGIALYYVKPGKFGNVFVYYGDFVKGLRSGNGIWAGANGSKYYWFEGQWSNDAPNGSGKAFWDTTTEGKGRSVLYKKEITGNYVDGLLDGPFLQYSYNTDGDITIYENVVANNGVLAHSGCTSSIHKLDTGYCAFVCDGDTPGSTHHMISYGEKNGVAGFGEV